ncbi:MAG: hypothetical protein MR639_07225 [Clostridium sp.]|uniref:lysine 5,6-aminomutase reactivase ATPase KamC n=1 Tax=Clostridium sp. TaxID=1506 RepID=UPI002A8BA304|nr:hypothetical protein [Clostridium sp.]MDY5097053.1 hypothetical protein [Clostridium sp.]
MDKFLNEHIRSQIGLDFVLNELQLITPFGRNIVKKLQPYSTFERDMLDAELLNLEKVKTSYNSLDFLYKNIEITLGKFKNIKNSIIRCENSETLDDVELYEIKLFAQYLEELLKDFYALNDNLNLTGLSFISLKEVVTLLDPDGSDLPTFYIYDSYSNKLREVRDLKRRIEKQIFKTKDSKALNSLKNSRRQCVLEEREIESSIREDLSDQLTAFTDKFFQNIKSIGQLDFLLGKAKLSIKYNAVRPSISKDLSIIIKDAVNPKVMSILSEQNKTFTPISIKLNKGSTVLTGANMGGKSVSLQTIILNVLLANMGFFVFCRECHAPILDFICFISDDMQSVSKGLSTFGAEIIELKSILKFSEDHHGLIVLDEFARGTNPKEGFYLVKSLCDYFNDKSSISLISTHYDNVADDTMVHYEVVGLKNMDLSKINSSVQENQINSIAIIQENMDYRLERVSNRTEVPKDALNIAMVLGLNKEILHIAEKYYKEGNNEK